jgi:hypothetical protein
MLWIIMQNPDVTKSEMGKNFTTHHHEQHLQIVNQGESEEESASSAGAKLFLP